MIEFGHIVIEFGQTMIGFGQVCFEFGYKMDLGPFGCLVFSALYKFHRQLVNKLNLDEAWLVIFTSTGDS